MNYNKELIKKDSENEEEYIWRICQMKDNGLIDLSWEELANLFNDELRGGCEEAYLNESAYRKPYQQAKRYFDAGVFNDIKNNVEYEAALTEARQELYKERQKLRDEKIEYNKWLREQARDELICEKICAEVRNLPKLQSAYTSKEVIIDENAKEEAIFCFGDTHFGAEFVVKGLYGEVINQYSPEIFEERMDVILQKLTAIIKSKNIKKLKVFALGDSIDGILRVSQLMKLRYGVIESAIKYADYMCNWLSELTKHVVVEYYTTSGNHSELRMLGQPKGTFAKENMEFVITEFIKERMRDNPRFELHKNETGLIFEEICGFNVMGIHGEVKNLASAVQTFDNLYNTKIDILVGGHCHHFSGETFGMYRDVLSVPSLVGADDYSMKIGKISNAGALMFIVRECEGIVEQYNIKI